MATCSFHTHSRANPLKRTPIHAPKPTAYTLLAAFFFVGEGEFVGLVDDAPVELAGVEGTEVLTSTYNSPVASELTNKRSLESKASPTGRKQSSGHLELSALAKMSVVEVVLSDGATGEPFAKAMETTL